MKNTGLHINANTGSRRLYPISENPLLFASPVYSGFWIKFTEGYNEFMDQFKFTQNLYLLCSCKIWDYGIVAERKD